MTSSRFILGVDLGTTNSAVACVDLQSASQQVDSFAIPQLVARGQVSPRKQLPSFIYIPGVHDLTEADRATPWGGPSELFVGDLARTQGARMPERMISSAKSWLCHGGVDRKAPILPWGVRDEQVKKISPVEASAAVLEHVAKAWNWARENNPETNFKEQDVMVTVPASFDEAARELTLSACEKAGLANVVLLEEPQAAFYAWMSGPNRSKELKPNSTLLVFDMGGGTTDFTLISVGDDGDSFERTAVGDHLLLGGDNVDLALAKQLETKIAAERKKKLDPIEWHGLVHSCRLAKETLLNSPDKESATVTVQSRSSKLIAGTIRDEITQKQLQSTMLDGFFPLVPKEDVGRKTRTTGLQEYGLPYASDPAVTRHLRRFLERHKVDKVDAVLFNGGAMTPTTLRHRIIQQVAEWQNGDVPKELANQHPELAVAQGAAYYGLVRRGLGTRIRGGTPRSYYVGVDNAGASNEQAICVATKGLDEGAHVELERDFELLTNRPVRFKLFSSNNREGKAGELVQPDPTEFLELPPIVTVLRARGRSKVTVRLEIGLTELGALEIHCVDQGEQAEKWKLAFDMRAGGAISSPEAETIDNPSLEEAKRHVRESFVDEKNIAQLNKRLEKLLDQDRNNWNMHTARSLFDAAFSVEEERLRSAECEARWLHLVGFCLRPGRGAPLDDWRVKQMWRIFNQGIHHPKSEQVRLAWWIAWRRIAGGMSQGQQEQIYDRLAQLFLPSAKQKKKWHQVKPSQQEAAEMWRTLANLERLAQGSKQKLGDELLRRMESKKGLSEPLYFWALGRIGARVPLYGPLNAVVPAERVEIWLSQLLDRDWPNPEKIAFSAASLGRRTGDRARELSDQVRRQLADKLQTMGSQRSATLVEEIVELESREERVALGDSLPPGLRLLSDQ